MLKRSKSSSEPLIGQFAGLWVTPNRRALIVSPYFVPGATGMRPERSYQPRLVREKAGKTLAKRLQWHDVPPGQCTHFDVESETTLFQRGLLRVLQALPIEELL